MIMRNLIIYPFLIVLIGLLSYSNTYSQKKDPSRIKVEYLKDADQVESLIISLVVKEDRYEPFAKAEIEVFHFDENNRILAGKVKTDHMGMAEFLIKNTPRLYFDAENLLNFEVVYAGSDTIKEASKTLAFKKGDMKISFFEEGEIGYLKAELSEIDSSNMIKPISEVEVNFYIQGTFSLLKIGQKDTDAQGKAVIEFPDDLPGDRQGNLTVVVKVVEDKQFGTIEAVTESNWGVPLIPVVEERRGLGDTDAPLWMVYTLIILLSAVWFHYMYVIYMIFRIKQSK